LALLNAAKSGLDPLGELLATTARDAFHQLFNPAVRSDPKADDLLSHSHAALVTSGTATLETALFNVPEVVCYKGNNISYQIAKRLIKIKYICLVNLIMDKEVVKELIQEDLNKKNLVHELSLLLNDENKKSQIKADYQILKDKLYTGQSATEVAANIIQETIIK
jgi:lipid-A-disaccharide synthase